ncbi:MAG: LLM class F420-dependent oxidoreductase [Dehalococcoidia bacterium]
MKLGLFSINMGDCSYPEVAGRVARLAEESGFESVWAGEHVVLPDPRVPPSPMEPLDRALDPVVALTYVAAQTSRIRLGTGIIILPQRNPLVLAKELASLDVLSNGRLIFGIGAGYLEPEFRALGAPFEDRGRATDEFLAAMRAVWTEDQPAYEGQFVSFSGIQSRPRPVQTPTPPIVVGGRSPAAFRRAARSGHGWYGFAMTPEETALDIESLRRAESEHGRPADLGRLEISITPRPSRSQRPDRDLVERFAQIGVDRLIFLPPPNAGEEGLAAFVESTAALAT